MVVLFIIASDVAVAATVLAVTSRAILHALLYLALSLVAVAVTFYIMGAPFVAGLEVIIYAGAIVVLFMFAVMLLTPAEGVGERHRARDWYAPAVLAIILLGELVYLMFAAPGAHLRNTIVNPNVVGRSLFGPYAVGVELASFLLLTALLGARHLASKHDVAPADELTEQAIAIDPGACAGEPAEAGPESAAAAAEAGPASAAAAGETS